MINHQDPFDRAKIYPDDIKNMSDENINKYRKIFAMKCFVPVFGNYMNKYSMKFEPAGSAWFNTTKSWFDFKTMIGYKEDVPKSVGVMNPTVGKNYIGMLQTALGGTAQPSGTFMNYNLVTDVKDVDKTTRGLRFDMVEAFMRWAPSDPDSKKEIGKVFDKTFEKLQKLYPPEQLPQVTQLFMERVGKRLESADVLGTIFKAEKEYWKGKDESKTRGAQELVDIARIRTYVDTLKGVGAEAKTQIPNILQNYSLGKPRNKNIVEKEVEMLAPPSITSNDALGNGGLIPPPSR
jgi:hypothetical protein